MAIIGNFPSGGRGKTLESVIVSLADSATQLTAEGFSFTPTWAAALKMTNPGNYSSNTITSVIAAGTDVRTARSGFVFQGTTTVEFAAGTVKFTYESAYFRKASYLILAGDGEAPEFPSFSGMASGGVMD